LQNGIFVIKIAVAMSRF